MVSVSHKAVFASLAMICAFPAIGGAAIYGNDDRVEIYETSPVIQALARSTVVVLYGDDFRFKQGKTREEDTLIYTGPDLQGQEDLRRGIRFGDQPAQGACSGTLVAKNRVLTAMHCITDNLKSMFFAFDYQMNADGSAPPKSYMRKDVYFAVTVDRRAGARDGFALVELDREVTDRAPLEFDDTLPTEGTSLYTIGYPSGLPAKYSDDAIITSFVADDEYQSYLFTHHLDTFHGSSGSAIFNKETNKILGILVSGEDDYKKRFLRKTYKPKVYRMNTMKYNEKGLPITKAFVDFVAMRAATPARSKIPKPAAN